MKRMKKFLAIMLAAVMVLSMGSVSVMATTVTSTSSSYSITVKNTSGSRTYVAYQIFTGTLSGGTLTNINIGTGIDLTKGNTVSADQTAITSYLKSSTLPISITVGTDSYTTVGALATAVLTGDVSLGNVADFLTTYGGTGTNQSENVLIAFADASYEYKSSEFVTAKVSTDPGSDGYYTYTFSGLEAGYYMIVETTDASNVDAVSRYMLCLTSDTTYTSKEVAPSLTKTLSDETTSTSASVGDSISYTLTSAIPDTTGYTTYTYEITDTINNALSLNTGTGTVSSNASDANLSALDIVVKVGSGSSAEKLSGILVSDSSDSAAAANYDYYYYTTTGTDTIVLKIVFNSMISLQSTYGKDTAITVTYSATLTTSADIGESGNENTAYITYSNKPSDSTSTGTTTEQKVVVYSYELDITKVDANDSSALPGAEFYLYKYDTDEDTKLYAIATGTCSTSSVTPSSSTAGNTYTLSSSGTTWTSDLNSATKMVSGTDGVVKIVGLGTGTYYLFESAAPSGYTEWSADKKIVIEATTSTSKVSTLTATVDDSTDPISGTGSTGIIEFDVTNTSSSALPTTGGIGTTLFYLIGTILVLGAAVVLVTRRRMAG